MAEAIKAPLQIYATAADPLATSWLIAHDEFEPPLSAEVHLIDPVDLPNTARKRVRVSHV
jgi:hypothetical protein